MLTLETQSKDCNLLLFSSSFSSFDNSYVPAAMAATYAIPGHVYASGVTQTDQGITTRMHLYFMENSIAAISSKFINARRHDVALSEEETFVGYDPVVPVDPKLIISHKNHVIGIKRIQSYPTTMESTCLVLSYGHDIYFTRMAPSGTFDMLNPNFSFSILLVTMIALLMGNIIIKSKVDDKALKAYWA
jgi:hypothetical protein